MAPRRNRKEDLLNAAELLFAERGYYGASMRDIAAVAKVQLGLCTYYFAAKEQLYEEVLRRRTDDHIAVHEQALEQLRAREPHPTVEQIVDAFITPYVRLMQSDVVWRRYLQILYQLAAFEERRALGGWLFGPHEHVVDIYVAALRKALPHSDPGDIRIAFLLARVLCLGFIANSTYQTTVPDPARFPTEALDAMVKFATAGLLAAIPSASQTAPRRPAKVAQ